ncbi:MAG TPA: histidine kinase [Baekduia sp.]|uniref:PAS domain-containing sensor histidine kinase n=1 Tax=Baekduia sp. TaxID=2600305 RepID=UPI002D777D25|nr:histidine kinase [Baekduia sp.]HET6509080.1 histidine kinase [Baekduia sp.]
MPAVHTDAPIELMAQLAAVSGDGLAIVDHERRFVYLNPAGAIVLGVDPERVLGQPALVFDAPGPTTTVSVPGVDGARTLQRREHAHGDHTIVVFSDATDRDRDALRLAAFARTAGSMVGDATLQGVLDTVAAALLEATGTAACTVVLYDATTRGFEQIGTAGGYPEDYGRRLEGCRRRGAPLASWLAYTQREPFVSTNWGRRVLADPRWAPMHPVIRGQDWNALCAVPVMTAERPIGALTAFYRGGQAPNAEEVSFLLSIGALVAVAVRNHRLLAALEQKATLVERHRIARDLHDSVTQSLFSLSLRTKALSLAHQSDDPERHDRVGAGLAEVRELTSSVLAEMRVLIAELRPEQLQDDGLAGAARRLADTLAARCDVAISVDDGPDLPPLAGRSEVEAFRILQEALSNAIHHAEARHVHVVLRRHDADADAVEISIEDDGKGFDPAQLRPGHFGLATMRERCEHLGGHLTIDSTATGTSVRAVITTRETP